MIKKERKAKQLKHNPFLFYMTNWGFVKAEDKNTEDNLKNSSDKN